jgi:hypothetical protein
MTSPATSKAAPKAKVTTAAPKVPKVSEPAFAGLDFGFLDPPRNEKEKEKATISKKPSQPLSRGRATAPAEDMPFIQPQPKSSAQDHLVLPEVQQAILDSKGSNPIHNPEFLKQLTDNPELMRGLQDPRMGQAMAQFSANPQAAMQMYKDDEKVQKFLLAYMNLLGSHLQKTQGGAASSGSPFVSSVTTPSQPTSNSRSSHPTPNPSLGSQGTQPPPVDLGDKVQFGSRVVPKAQLHQWLSNPHIRAALDDSETARAVQICNADPAQIERFRHLPGVSLLIQHGIIAVPEHMRGPQIEEVL